jgi:3-hydroxyisobutyrate dehydrogenase
MTELNAGVIGLGAMGAPMARNLAAQGRLRGVWNRTFDRAREFAETHQVRAYADPAALSAEVDVLISCVSADADLRDVIDRAWAGFRPGLIVVDTSTVEPTTAQTLASELAGSQVEFLDAPVSGGVEGAKAGTLSIMVGGSEVALERARPLLNLLGQRITYMGPSGAGQATKAVNQVLVAGIAQAVSEGLALAESLELPLDRVVEVIMNGAASNWFLGKRAPTMLNNEFDLGFKSELMLKDLRICERLKPNRLPGVTRAIEGFAELVARGHGSNDISALIRLARERVHEAT